MTTAGPDRPLAVSGGYPWRAGTAAGSTGPTPLPDTPAGMVTRSLANVVDVLVVALLVGTGWLAVAAGRFLVHPARFTFPSPGGRALLIIGLGVLAAYYAITWAIVGGTYGDRLLALRVLDRRGARLHWWRCVARAVLCTVFPIGLFWVLVSRGNRSVQDIVLRTSVVRDG